MNPLTIPLANTLSADEDLAEQAKPGHGIPSQDPNPAAQSRLEPEDAEREAHSALIGGGVMAGAVRLHIDDGGGGGRPVVLIHGWPLSAQAWEPQVSVLQAAGYRVVAYDRRGFRPCRRT